MISALLKAIVYIAVSFIAGALIGYITRTALKIAALLLLSIGVGFALDISGFIDIGLDTSLLDSIIATFEVKSTLSGLVQYIQNVAHHQLAGAGPNPATTLPLGEVAFLVGALPFLVGFFFALNPR